MDPIIIKILTVLIELNLTKIMIDQRGLHSIILKRKKLSMLHFTTVIFLGWGNGGGWYSEVIKLSLKKGGEWILIFF